MRLTPDQQELLASHGPYGRTLTSQAKAGNPDAVYQAALLLGTSPAHCDDAVTFLIEAAATGHHLAPGLLDDNPGHTPSFSAACLAHAHTAEAEGLYDQARAFRKAAAHGRTAGDPTAADGAPGQQQNAPGDPCH